MFPIPTLQNNFGPKNFGLKLEKSTKIFCLKIGRNFFFIMQSGYGEQTLSYKFFSFVIEKNLSAQLIHYPNQGFVILLTGATESDYFEIGFSTSAIYQYNKYYLSRHNYDAL